MNENHALCATQEWASFLHESVLEPLVAGVDLGEDMIEFGPGPGASTSWLCHRVRRLTVVELDPVAAARLSEKFENTNVTVITGDCTRTGLADGSFDSVGTFTMLHHIPTQATQLAVLAEAFRLLKPGGVLVGSDSLASTELHDFHEGDTYNPIDPARLLVFLQACGFGRLSLHVDTGQRFTAHKSVD
jgi:SAM-dependent methyltransferase